jgi:hypothetical protein
VQGPASADAAPSASMAPAITAAGVSFFMAYLLYRDVSGLPAPEFMQRSRQGLPGLRWCAANPEFQRVCHSGFESKNRNDGCRRPRLNGGTSLEEE